MAVPNVGTKATVREDLQGCRPMQHEPNPCPRAKLKAQPRAEAAVAGVGLGQGQLES